jgi:hypothetical protein
VSLRRKAVPQVARSQTQSKSFPAPVLGWVSAQNQAAAKPGSALVLENWFPTATGIELMGGSQKHATVHATDPCMSVFTYIGASSEKLFGATDDEVFDITSPADPDTPPSADVSSRTDGYYAVANYVTVGGNYMYAVNDSATDGPLLYDGSSWMTVTAVSTPAITGITGGTVGLTHVSVYRNRLAFAKGYDIWFLPVDVLGGAAIQVSLAGVFKRGGTVLFSATWSLDSGDGLDDKFVVVSTTGEFAVYQGSDPSDPTDWSLVGLYDCPPPLGKNGYMRAGGDLIVCTEAGLVPISQAIAKDVAALSLAAVSRNIQPDWVDDARQRRGLPWEIVKWPSKNRAIVSNPVTGDDTTTPPWCYVVNLETGAWCKRTGWNTRCMTHFSSFVYFGTNTGTVMQAEITGADDGEIYYAKAVLAWDHLGAPGFEKAIISARGQFVTQNTFIPQISVSTDYAIDLPSPPNVSGDIDSPGVWDVGVWDVAAWDTGTLPVAYNTRWGSVGQSGYVIAPQVQVSCGSVTTPSAELVILDVLYERGEVML